MIKRNIARMEMPFSTSDLTRRYFHSSHENESFNQMLISKRICTTSPRSFNEFQVKQVFSKDGWKLETFHEPATVTERGRHFFFKVFPIPIHLRKSYLFLPFFSYYFFIFLVILVNEKRKWRRAGSFLPIESSEAIRTFDLLFTTFHFRPECFLVVC